MLIVLGSRGGDDAVVCRIVTDVLMVIESLCNFFSFLQFWIRSGDSQHIHGSYLFPPW